MSGALDELWWREEILQAMYWMRGEGIAEEVTGAALVSFLARDEKDILGHLERLTAAGDLVKTEQGTYALSEQAMGEAAALFARDFDEMVNRSEHGSECTRPDCLCHTLGPDECLGPEEDRATA